MSRKRGKSRRSWWKRRRRSPPPRIRRTAPLKTIMMGTELRNRGVTAMTGIRRSTCSRLRSATAWTTTAMGTSTMTLRRTSRCGISTRMRTASEIPKLRWWPAPLPMATCRTEPIATTPAQLQTPIRPSSRRPPSWMGSTMIVTGLSMMVLSTPMGTASPPPACTVIATTRTPLCILGPRNAAMARMRTAMEKLTKTRSIQLPGIKMQIVIATGRTSRQPLAARLAVTSRSPGTAMIQSRTSTPEPKRSATALTKTATGRSTTGQKTPTTWTATKTGTAVTAVPFRDAPHPSATWQPVEIVTTTMPQFTLRPPRSVTPSTKTVTVSSTRTSRACFTLTPTVTATESAQEPSTLARSPRATRAKAGTAMTPRRPFTPAHPSSAMGSTMGATVRWTKA